MLFRSEGFQKYLKNTSWMFVDRMIRLGSVLVTGIYMARYLRDEGFGHLNYASGFVGLFFALQTMGLEEIVVRDLVKHPEKRDELLGSSAMLKFLGGVLLGVVVLIGTFVNHMDGLTTAMVMIIAFGELFKSFGVIEFFFQANVQGEKTAQVNITQSLVSGLFKLALCWFHAPLVWFAWSYVLDTLASSIGFQYTYGRAGLRWRDWKVTKAMLGHLLQQSWPLLLYGIALYVHARIDQVMIYDVLKRTSLGEEGAYAQVGQYSVALKMIEAMGFLPVIVQKSLAPSITRARMESRAKYEDRLLNQYRLMFALFLVTAIPLYLTAEWIVVLLYGEPYRVAGGLLALFAVRLFFTNMGVAKSSFITNESLFKYSLMTAVVGAVANIVLNYYLIPLLQAEGAILATIISFALSIFVVDLFYREARPNLKWMLLGMGTFWRLHRFY